jgi:hypothetical protein
VIGVSVAGFLVGGAAVCAVAAVLAVVGVRLVRAARPGS